MSCKSEIVAGSAIAKLNGANALEQFQTFDDLIEFTSNPASRLDIDTVRLVTSNMNIIVNRHELDNYPVLGARAIQSDLTSAEMSQFVIDWGYTEFQLAAQTTDIVNASLTPPVVPGESIDTTPIPAASTTPAAAEMLTQVDLFYNTNIPSSISNNVCALFGVAAVVFGSIATINDNIDKLNELKNGTGADIAKLKALNVSLDEVIDTLATKYIGQIKNLADNATTEIANLGSSTDRMFKAMNKRAFEAEAFYSKDRMNSLKSKKESIISGMAAQFEDLTPEAIAFIMFRLCQLVEVVDVLMSGPADKMKAFNDLTISQFKVAGVIQSAESITSIVEGAWRMPPDERVSRRVKAVSTINGRRAGDPIGSTIVPYVSEPLTQEEMQLIRGLDENGTDNFFFANSVLNMGTVATDNHIRTGIDREWNASENTPDAGWKYVAIHHPEVYVKLARISKKLGVRFKILSAYRSPWYNRVYQRDILGNKGAAFNSKHMSGMALDIAMRNNGVDYNVAHADFAKVASLEGIGGMALYNNFVHIDTSTRRTWNTSKRLTVQEKNVIQAHTRDAFRKGLA
ncbi:MAG: hypothetical protein COA84_13120 [Robiginitomaculum sp.]|nr:MAG: hypothetical protein COA84_13120 [Robiginitomaculum sp.]